MMPLSIDFANLHTILATLYDEMLPLCEDMMDVARDLPDWVRCSTLPSVYGSRWHVPNR